MLFLSVVLCTLSQPSFFCEDGLSFLAWIAYIPFFLLLDTLPLRRSPIFGFLYGFLLYTCLCPYLSAFGLVALFFVCSLFGLYHAVLFSVFAFINKTSVRSRPYFFFLLRIFLLVSFDFLRARGILGFSYGIIGYSQWQNPVFLKFSSFFGVNGVSFFIYAVNSVLYEGVVRHSILKNHSAVAHIQKKWVFIVILSFFLIPFALFFLPHLSSEYANCSVALIQNASSASSSSISDFEADVRLLKKCTDEALLQNPETSLVVWPETAVVPSVLYHAENLSDSRRHALAVDLIEYFRSKNCAFVIGNNHIAQRQTFNAALFFSPDSDDVQVYSKNHLVPFTEFWPRALDFKVFDGIKEAVHCEFFTPAQNITLFAVNGVKFGTPICFEDSFSSLLRCMNQKGAAFFVNITDDAWAHSAAAQNIHVSMSAFRAAECNAPLIRSTIDGRTCIIDANGSIVSLLERGIDGFLCGEIAIPKNARTPYALFGDAPLFLILGFILVLMLILSARFVTVK